LEYQQPQYTNEEQLQILADVIEQTRHNIDYVDYIMSNLHQFCEHRKALDMC
jgi:hypothetical protein